MAIALRWVGWIVGGCCGLVAILISIFLIYKHLRNYTRPNIQRYIVRILFMLPIYATCSFMSLVFYEHAKYFDLFRDCYEAYLLYSFFALLINFINEYKDEEEEERKARGDKPQVTDVEEDESDSDEESRPLFTIVEGHKVYLGEERVIYVLKTKPRMTWGDGCHPIPTPCCRCQFGTGRVFLRWTKRCILQFVVMQPLLATIIVILEHYEVYNEGSFSFSSGYVYIAFTMNTSITISMYFLVLFYHAVQEELSPFRPIPKFLCIKAIILFAFWQSVIVAVLLKYDLLPSSGDYSPENVATSLQDFLILMELVFIAIASIFIFGHNTYRDPNKRSLLYHPIMESWPVIRNLWDCVDQRDVVRDLFKSFKFGSHKAEYMGMALAEQERRRQKYGDGYTGGLDLEDDRRDRRRYSDDDRDRRRYSDERRYSDDRRDSRRYSDDRDRRRYSDERRYSDDDRRDSRRYSDERRYSDDRRDSRRYSDERRDDRRRDSDDDDRNHRRGERRESNGSGRRQSPSPRRSSRRLSDARPANADQEYPDATSGNFVGDDAGYNNVPYVSSYHPAPDPEGQENRGGGGGRGV